MRLIDVGKLLEQDDPNFNYHELDHFPTPELNDDLGSYVKAQLNELRSQELLSSLAIIDFPELVFVLTDDVKPASPESDDFWEQHFSPISCGIKQDGSLRLVDIIDGLNGLTLNDIQRAIDEGFLSGDLNRITVVVQPGGWGGIDDVDWLDFFSGVGAGVLANYLKSAVDVSWQKSSQHVRKRTKVGTVAQKWAVDMGLNHPHQLREFIDRKENWTTQRVCKLLVLNQHAAEDLMNKLGYTLNPHNDTWTLGTDPKSKQARKTWRENEHKRD